MPIPRCPREGCRGTTFMLTVAKLTNTVYQVPLVQCAQCGTVIGVEHFDISERIDRQVREIAFKLNSISRHLDETDQHLAPAELH